MPGTDDTHVLPFIIIPLPKAQGLRGSGHSPRTDFWRSLRPWRCLQKLGIDLGLLKCWHPEDQDTALQTFQGMRGSGWSPGLTGGPDGVQAQLSSLLVLPFSAWVQRTSPLSSPPRRKALQDRGPADGQAGALSVLGGHDHQAATPHPQASSGSGW